jgi:hypothetical protein
MSNPSLGSVLAPLEHRIEDLEAEMLGIEDKLNKILAHLPKTVSEEVESGVSFTLSEPRKGSYQYDKLDESSNEIRIIVLHSCLKEEHPVACQLLHASVDLELGSLASLRPSIGRSKAVPNPVIYVGQARENQHDTY